MVKNLPLVNPSLPGCRGCTALCCHDLWLALAPPRSPDEVADVKWRLHFEGVEIHVSGAEWLMRVKGRCRYLGDDNMCTVYEQRPRHCRDHRPPYCQRYIDGRPIVLKCPEDVDAYMASTPGS
jgi:Fe-S-cluster containining protein